MTVFLVGAGPGDPGLLTVRAVELLGSADVVLYDRLIPPGALRHARPEAELIYVGKQGGGPQMPQEEIDRLLVEHGRAGQAGGAAEGRRPVRLRPRRRGGAQAARGGHRVRDRARHHRGRRRARLRRHPRDAPRAGQRRRLRHRPRGPRQAGVDARLGRARALPRHARLLHGRPRAAADRRAAAGRGTAAPTNPSRWSSAARCPASARCWRRSPTSQTGRRSEQIKAPAVTLVGPVAALREDLAWLERRPAARPDDRRHAGARAGEPARRPAARARRRRDRGARHPHRVAARRGPGPRPATTSSSPRARTACASCSAASATPASLAGADAWRRWAPAPHAPSGSTGSRPTSCPPAPSPRGWSRRSPASTCAARSIARGKEGRDVLPDALRERGAHVDVLALYETVPEPLDDDGDQSGRRTPTTSRSPPPPPCAISSPRPERRR